MKLLKFYSKNCPPCKALSGLLAMPEFEGLEIEEIDVYSEEGYEIVMERGLRRVPTLIKVCDDGAESVIEGLPSINELAAFLGLLVTQHKKD
jgi:thiol-disulfide isomerase/thioredoxin